MTGFKSVVGRVSDWGLIIEEKGVKKLFSGC